MLAQARPFGHGLFASGLGFVAALSLIALPAKSDPFESPWTQQAGGKAEMRLIAAGLENNIYRAAVEIELVPTAITYWREPGEAGVPPKFSVTGSQNVANAEILFPAPQRMNEQGIEAFGYRGGVTFPIHVAAQDQQRPVRLRLSVNYAVCDNICLPVESSAELILPKSSDGSQEAAIAAAEARVPVALTPKEVEGKFSLEADETATNPTWVFTWKSEPPPTDLFAEAPDGWALDTQRLPDGRFSIVAVEQPTASAVRRLPVKLTLSGSPKSYEFATLLDLPSKPAPLPASSKQETVDPLGTR